MGGAGQRDGAMNGYFFLIPSLSPLSDPAILHLHGLCEKPQYIQINHHVCKLAFLGFCSSVKLPLKTIIKDFSPFLLTPQDCLLQNPISQAPQHRQPHISPHHSCCKTCSSQQPALHILHGPTSPPPPKAAHLQSWTESLPRPWINSSLELFVRLCLALQLFWLFYFWG